MYANKGEEDAEFLVRCCVFGVFALITGMVALIMLIILAGGAT